MFAASLQSVRTMNNSALSAFAEGRTQEAHAIFQRAMREVKILTELGHQQQPVEATPMIISGPCMKVTAFPLKLETTFLSNRSSFEADTSFLSMYQKAFAVVGQETATMEDLELICSVLLYNWALLFHSKGIFRRISNLENALRLYRTSTHLLHNYLGKPSVVFTSDLQRLFCALLSNMAHICSHRFDQGKMQEYLAQLRGVLQIPTLDVCYDNEGDNDDEMEEEEEEEEERVNEDFGWFQFNGSLLGNAIQTAPAA